MRNLLALFAILLLTFAGVGWYRGWYAVASQESTTPGRSSFLFEVDRVKIVGDAGEAARTVQGWFSKETNEEDADRKN